MSAEIAFETAEQLHSDQQHLHRFSDMAQPPSSVLIALPPSIQGPASPSASFKPASRSGSSVTTAAPGATLARIVSACSGALLTSLLMTPFDVVKTRQQTMAHNRTVLQIVRNEGGAALWKGLSPTLVISVPSTVLYYVGYEKFRNQISAPLSSIGAGFMAPLLAGSITRGAVAAIVSPIELVRTRMQGKTDEHHSLAKTLKRVRFMTRQFGILYLWRGLIPTLWRDIPFSAMYWVGYEQLKPLYSRYLGGGDSKAYSEFRSSFAAGATSGMIAAIATTPFDVAKSIQQVDTSHSPQKFSCSPHGRMTCILRELYRTEGLPGLFKGIVPRISKIAPACAIMISTYEVGKQFFSMEA
ncbi:mitochondrial carrier domain-containing protein [Polychytrium aggregatum]|uniref:mitochondrial carrier domain-containing protein n=1 Tax=Polychytrium aggregatum TaxID=110093 RepID=UPI0022FDE162|nr:mitochondrial carrier domain-containing protein [Polychytrium aggregatum]XP_052971471.1 mitochondrial carrier domain-containing protein [Polychytrium aggregatum]KAI9193239.1 mitochondrial carrier domain-containing protein [Polychytrium aggregatum]KAI9209391.1 mitochondrial carrier domain-containing protein [Polychytrium aggregatum]